MRVIVGLGNPGEEYKFTRHNAGFLAVEALAKTLDLKWSADKKCGAEIAKSRSIILVKPMSFMNNSGDPVRAVLSYYRLLPKVLGIFSAKNADLSPLLTVIHDEIDLALGRYKLSVDSGSAGHKGVVSVISALHTRNFTRLRLGIRTDSATNIPTDKFVLQKFGSDELDIVLEVIAKALAEIKLDRITPLW